MEHTEELAITSLICGDGGASTGRSSTIDSLGSYSVGVRCVREKSGYCEQLFHLRGCVRLHGTI